MLITFEGLDGSGKTTQAARLRDWLQARGYAVLLTREPGGTAIGDAIRVLLADPRHTHMHARAEALLFCAARAQLVHERLKPHLSIGGVVICDRFADSTLAYQGYGRGLPLDRLRQLLDFATEGLTPALTFYLDVRPEVGLQRRQASGTVERMDQEQLAFYYRVREGYLQLAQQSARWIVLDAEQSVEQLAEQVRQHVAQRLRSAQTT